MPLSRQDCTELLDRQQNIMTAFAVLLLPDPACARMAVQDALTLLCRRPPRSSQTETLAVLQCTLHAAARYARDCTPAPMQDKPAQTLAMLERMQKLSFSRRAAVLLRYYFGLSPKQISLVMQRPQLWVQFVLGSALRQLEKL